MSTKQKNKLFFLGLSGVSMRSLAVLSYLLGAEVSGSDLYPDNFIYPSIKNYPQSNEPLIDNTYTEIIYNSEIPQANINITLAEKLGIPVVHRTIFMDKLTKKYKKLCISGMSGKTSTTFFTVSLCNLLNLPTNAMIGEETLKNKQCFQFNDSEDMILELNEGDMWHHIDSSKTLIITNIIPNPDHIWLFKDEQHLFECYKQLIQKTETLIYCSDYDILNTFVKSTDVKNTISYGFGNNADCQIRQINFEQDITHVTIAYRGEIYTFQHQLLGKFNTLNVVAAILAVHIHFNTPIANIITKTLSLYQPQRRLEKVFDSDERVIFRDQALHPFEMKNTIEAVQDRYGNNISIYIDMYNDKRVIFKNDTIAHTNGLRRATNNKFLSPEIPYLTDQEIYQFITNTKGVLIFSYKGVSGNILHKWLQDHKDYNKL